MNVFDVVNHNQLPVIKGFGIEVDKKFIKVLARKLDTPTIQYKNATIKPKNGYWNPVNMKFLLTEISKTGVEWGILNADIGIKHEWILQLCDKVSGSLYYINPFVFIPNIRRVF